MDLTLAQLRAIAPHAPESCLGPLCDAMQEFEIDRPLRQAAFLAQVMFECNQGRDLVELDDGTRYEGRRDLGNTQPGDGPRFKGRGAIQLTGRANYTRASGALGVDLVAHPELAADPRYAYRLAGWYWHQHALNPLADDGDVVGITKAINGGTLGLAIRLEYYTRSLRALGCSAVCGEGA